MLTRRTLALIAAVALVASACSTSESSVVSSSPTTLGSSSTASVQPGPELPAVLTNLGLGLDVETTFGAFCIAYRFDLGYDEGSLNDAIASFFANNPDRSSPFQSEQLDEAVRQACAEDSAVEGIATALDLLSLTSPDIEVFIDDACLRYANAPSIRGVAGAQEFDRYVRDWLDMDNDQLTDLVVRVCGNEPFDAYEPPPSPVPDPELTPGEFDGAFDVQVACAVPPAVPEIPSSLIDEVLTAYDADAARFAVHRLVPIELGGLTTAKNLFPIPIDASPGAHDKPEVDRLVTELVCDGHVEAPVARQFLIANWPIAYSSLR